MPTLPPGVYWRLRYLQAESEKQLALATAAELRFREALAGAGVPPGVEHTWHDATTALVPVEASSCDPSASSSSSS